MNLVTIDSAMTMTSREISELTGKELSNVHRDIRTMLADLMKDDSLLNHPKEDVDARGYTTCIHLSRELTETLLTGYSAPARLKVIRRWHELEDMQPVQVIPNFSNPAQAARAWAEQYEARLIAESTKAEIGNRREATAMNTASQAVKKANRLEIELDQSKQYASIKRMEMLYHGQSFNWRLLKSAANEMSIAPIDVFDANYGTVKAYHADVWREAYAVGIEADAIAA